MAKRIILYSIYQFQIYFMRIYELDAMSMYAENRQVVLLKRSEAASMFNQMAKY